MRPYIAILKMKLIAGLQYRAAAWAGVCTQFFWGFMYVMIYMAFYESSTEPPPMTMPQLATYIWMQQAFMVIIMLWVQDNELLQDIASGAVAYELCRPYDTYTFWFVRLIALRVSGAAMRCLPILLAAFLLPAPYRFTVPPSVEAAGLFLFSFSLATVLVVAISMFIYLLTFITLSPLSSRLIVGVASEFLGGTLLPIPLMPQGLQNILNWLPFRYTTDLPFRIYSGNIAIPDALTGIVVQTFWIILLILLGAAAFRKRMNKIVIQGG